MSPSSLRPDLKAIASLVEPESLVLDIGCGTGELLRWLTEHKQVEGRGIDMNQQKVAQAIAQGLSVIHGDADEDLAYYPDNTYDYVVASQTLQAMKHPRDVLEQMERIGRRVIVNVPNFGHWKNRMYLGLHGRMPMSEALSYAWYETPNIHFCTIRDFLALAEEMQLSVKERYGLNKDGDARRFHGTSPVANLFAEQGLFLLEKSE